MKKFLYSILVLAFAVTSVFAENPLAFPGAEGYGSVSIGGRGGKIIEVTNLNDNGPGSFRTAVEDSLPRIVVFKVSGTIELKSELRITQSFLTIAGQSAPGDGICLKNYPLIIDGTEHITIRGIRIRPGIESGLIGSEIDGLQIRNSQYVIVDHCTVSWSVDEMLNTWHGSKDITIQWCIFAEPLNRSIHEKGAHGFGATIGGIRASYHHNLFANSTGRNPSIGGNRVEKTELMDYRNNVIYNYCHRTCDGKPTSINMVNNYYKPGPGTKASVMKRVAKLDDASKYGFTSKWYIDGNFIEGFPEIEKNNIDLGVEIDGEQNKADVLATEPFPTLSVKTETATEAFHSVIQNAGNFQHDSWEKRLIDEVKTGSVHFGDGYIDKVEDSGSWPILKSSEAPVDTDHDGMPDTWELQHKLDPKNPIDGLEKNDEGHTNVEVYLNGLCEVNYN